MGAAFIVLIGGSIAAALLLLGGRHVWVAWRIAGMLSLGAMVGYVLSRSLGLPQLADHVGHWADPAGVAALTFEGAIVVLASGEVSRIPSDRLAPAVFSLALGVLGLAAVGAGGATHSPPEAGGHAAVVGTHGAVGYPFGGEGYQGGHAHGGDPRPAVLPARGHGPHGDVAQYPDLAQATPEQRSEARRLWLNSKRCTADIGVDTVGGARSRGYRVISRTGLWHLTNPKFGADGVVLDASRAAWSGGDADGCRIETLAYSNPRNTRDCTGCRLVAAVYRLPTPRLARLGGPIIRWHGHQTGNGLPMSHVWFTNDLRSAYAFKPPRELRLK